MSDLLRLLALDGPVVGVGMLIALAWLIVRLESTRAENAAAHAAITRNVDGVKQQLTREIDGAKQQSTREIDGVKQQLTKEIDGVKQDVRDVKQDVRDVKQDVRMLTAHLLDRKTGAGDGAD